MTQSVNPVCPEAFLWEEVLPGGCHWSGLLRRGTALRVTDTGGRANLSALFYRADEKLERYNMPDTLKAQHTSMLTRGHALYSDMGRVMCSITADTCGWHDTIGGLSTDEGIEARYGKASYQTHRNAMYRSAEDGLLIELGKYGLGRRDLVPNVNFFSKVMADRDGRLHFDRAHGRAGAWLDLRFDMDVLAVFSAAPHALDPRPDYAPADVVLTAWRCGPADATDHCRNVCAENQRGFYRTELLYR
ncbi:MAG: urea carboxylase-associated family protein [Betaproteobacteria bacterium]|nr:urea carboxylase-associated family protein [Betaproteobacteria bacterium]